MGKTEKATVTAELAALKHLKGNPRARCKIAAYLAQHPEARELFDEAADWFALNRTDGFGVVDLLEYLRGKTIALGLPPFEVSRATMDRWLRRRGRE